MKAIRRQCQRVEMLKLFLDHVLQPDVDLRLQETVCSNLRLIYAALKDPDFSTSPSTFHKVRHAIENCCRKGGQVLLGFKDVQECALCLESVNLPVILPCGHIGCKSCLREHFQLDTIARTCPKNGCQAGIPQDFLFQSEAKIEQAAAQHASFRRKLTQFFIEMVQRFVFTEGQMPHQVHNQVSRPQISYLSGMENERLILVVLNFDCPPTSPSVCKSQLFKTWRRL